MSPHEINVGILAFLFLLFVTIVAGGPYLWRTVILLGLLGLLGVHPVLGFSLLVVCTLWRPIKWAGEFFIGGFFAAEGAKAAGLFRGSNGRRPRRSRHWSRGAPRLRGWCGGRNYFPFDDNIDHLGE